MKFDSAGVVVNKITFYLEKIQPPNFKKIKTKTNTKFLSFGHEPVGPSPSRVNRSAETVLYIRLANNGLLKINAQSSV
jgi:hypothetical protein